MKPRIKGEPWPCAVFCTKTPGISSKASGSDLGKFSLKRLLSITRTVLGTAETLLADRVAVTTVGSRASASLSSLGCAVQGVIKRKINEDEIRGICRTCSIFFEIIPNFK